MTQEQEETLEKLRVAINDHLKAMGWLDERLLSEFVVVSCAEDMSAEQRGNFYTLTQSSAVMPFHHVVGLLHCGLKWHYENDDDD